MERWKLKDLMLEAVIPYSTTRGRNVGKHELLLGIVLSCTNV